ncbi:hypothetical protein M2271_004498 [Streptomyces sp. LBL]|uniref:hypothetical protein n=1 Tax=Streptomyces sp. LBL TaxID=2940562 RepID=UPI002474F2D5|nr:hypothetical protein [Streptomyces sp. LBL]MDH6626681.1 hypothetical protein [Streptomyces sp. LBL]
MNIAPQQANAQRLDRANCLAEVRVITQPRLDVPPLADTMQRAQVVSGMLSALLEESRGDDREAVRVMRRLGTRLLDESPQGESSPYSAWQHLVNLARCVEALVDVESRSR